MMCFLRFRNAAGWLSVDLPGVHVHPRPMSSSAGTISLLATFRNHTHILSTSTLHLPPSILSPWLALTYGSARCRGQEEGKDTLFRKRKVLQLVSHWSRLYKDFLKEEEHVRSFMKVRATHPTSQPRPSNQSLLFHLDHEALLPSHMCHWRTLQDSFISICLHLSCSGIGLSSLKCCIIEHQAILRETGSWNIVALYQRHLLFNWSGFVLSHTRELAALFMVFGSFYWHSHKLISWIRNILSFKRYCYSKLHA